MWAFKLVYLFTLSSVLLTASCEENWSWGSGKKTETEEKPKSDTTAEGSVNPNVIDEIISSGRDGRMLSGFSDVYEDQDVQDALSSGNETHARSLVKDRLCGLGLMACDEDIEEKRPFIQPQDLIYAQPVHLKPVGRPIAAVPLKGSPNSIGYGPPKPVPFPPSNFGNSYPPVPPPRPYISANKPPLGPIYGASRPPAVYEPIDPIDKKPQVVVNAQHGVQQHVHHHYHHADAEKIGVIDAPNTVYPSGVAGGVGSLYNGENSLYGNTVGGNGFIGSPTYGGGLESYGGGPSPFYKKELNLKGTASSNGVSNYVNPERYQSYETPRADNNLDCVCVPFDQCLPHEVISRKEDGYAIDPRNSFKTNIEAIGPDDVVITDGNGTVVSVKKLQDEIKPEENNENKEEKARRRRHSDLVGAASESQENKIEARKLGGILGGSGGGGGGGGGGGDDDSDSSSSGIKLRPTFGVSFGLPSGGAGYPISPYGPNPAINPYGHSLGGGNGLNLGLVNVNPLLSLQVSKDEYGDKVVKPWVNLHVTPNHQLVDKFGYLVHKLKDPHHYGGYPPSYYHHHNHFHSQPQPPPYYPPSRPYYPSRPPHYGYNNYAPSYHGYNGVNYNSLDYAPTGYEDEDDYDSGFYRNANSNASAQNSDQYKRTAYPEQSDSKSSSVVFPNDRVSGNRKRRQAQDQEGGSAEQRQGYFGLNKCGPRQVCCRRPLRQPLTNRPGFAQCGRRNTQGINGRIKTPVYVDGDSEFGEYPWQAAILKKDTQESVYVCGGTLIDNLHIITAAHCVKSYTNFDLRVRLGEWDVNHDVEFYPYIERDVANLFVHPEFYAGTLFNDIAILRLDKAVDFTQYPHISPACLPEPGYDFSGQRCWTTGWGKDAFGEFGKYQNILKEVDVPVISYSQCQSQLQQTRLGYDFKLHPGFVCAGGEEGKDACKGDGGGPMVCEKGGIWNLVGVVSWGVGCGQYGVPGVYAKVSYYLDWIRQITNRY
ncbi:uncharacterized protein LOC135840503 isoform X2 [Planococcus citri]|uniref:uncharacterized protein LOC135840503 isoform X2 n=1 Tax=Planococcus citri TaxID=170843 RepID=UPI0031F7AEE5